MRTLNLFSMSQKQILARLVDLPTPFTPQKVTTYGRPLDFACHQSCRGHVKKEI
jgi:hypothetical protein